MLSTDEEDNSPLINRAVEGTFLFLILEIGNRSNNLLKVWGCLNLSKRSLNIKVFHHAILAFQNDAVINC